MIGALFLMLAGAGSADGTVNKTVATREFAACLVRLAERQSKKFLQTVPGSDTEKNVGRDLLFSHNGCVGPRHVFSVSLDAIRGALAETWFARTPATLDAAAALPPTASARLPNGIKEAAFRPAFAACVAASAPAKTAAVLRTGHGSVEERQAVLAMGDALMACLPTDITYRLKTDELRPYLASALFYEETRSAPGG